MMECYSLKRKKIHKKKKKLISDVLVTSFASWKPDHHTYADSADGVSADMLSSAVYTHPFISVLACVPACAFFFFFVELYESESPR